MKPFATFVLSTQATNYHDRIIQGTMEELTEQGLSRKQIEEARNNRASLQVDCKKESIEEMPLRIHVLASGSKGNASLVENTTTGEGILVDCGICKRDVLARSAEAGFDLKKLKAILITHEHSDHTKGLKVLYRELVKRDIEVPLFVNRASAENSKPIQEAAELTNVVSLNAEDQLSLAGMQVFSFATSHDAASSFGFRIWKDNDTLGFMTDTGVVTGAAHEALKDCRILALEANHDPAMLKNGPYPRALQERVASDFGHLSNSQASDELRALLHPGLEEVICMHVSENNNTYRLPVESLRHAVQQEGHSATVVCAYQQRLVSR